MENSHEKSSFTIFLDLFRNTLIFIATGYIVYLLWSWHWLSAIILAIPIYIIVMNIIGFMTLPFYRLTPENRRLKEEFDKFDNF